MLHFYQVLSNGEFLAMDCPVKPSRPGPAKAVHSDKASLLPAPWRTRQDHSQELAQDYVEIIADLIDTTGEARASDLAKRLGVTHVTVSRAIRRLQRSD